MNTPARASNRSTHATTALSDAQPPQTDTVVAALADQQRRAVLAYLQQVQSGTATVEELASFIIEHEDERSS